MNVDQYMNKTSCVYYMLWLDSNEINDNIQATPILKGGKVTQLLDPNLGIEYDDCQMKRMVLAASLCIRRVPRLRPQISLVSLFACAKMLHSILPFTSFWIAAILFSNDADIETSAWWWRGDKMGRTRS